jgi:peptidoglycan/LPS O-acetylase OafA/YrhL
VVLAVYVAFPVLREAPNLEAWWQFATFTLNPYSLYLSHTIAMHVVHTWIAPALPLQGLALFSVYATVILAAGAALHNLVERPGLRMRDRLGRSPRAIEAGSMPA